MQLPRGTFRSIQKGVTLGVLLRELNDSLFCGYCTISAAASVSTLVLDRGKCVLAEYRHLKGDDAWKVILDQSGSEVDVELRDLSSTQLQLALEFNASAVVERTPSPSDLFGYASGMKPDREGTVTGTARAIPDPSGISDARAVSALNEQPRAASARQVQDSEIIASINRDLDALDAMDLESMAQKIRQSCKRTVRRLHLEHLIEEE